MAQSGATVTRTFPVGLGRSETAQIAVVNLASASSGGPAASCIGIIALFNAASTAIGTATTFTLGTGQVASARLPFASVGGSGVRALIRGLVTVTRTAGSGVSCTPAATRDIFDNSNGVTNHRYAGEEAISPENEHFLARQSCVPNAAGRGAESAVARAEPAPEGPVVKAPRHSFNPKRDWSAPCI